MRKLNENLKSITSWSKSKQAGIIEQIVSQYPTAKDFKEAVLKSGDQQSISIVQNMDETMNRGQYIDFLQYVFIKHSNTGKILANSLVGLGVGAGLAYLLGKIGSERMRNNQIAKETGLEYDPVKGEYNFMATNKNKIINSPIAKGIDSISDTIGSTNLTKDTGIPKSLTDLKSTIKGLNSDNIINLPNQLKTLSTGISGDDFSKLATNVSNDLTNNSGRDTYKLGKDIIFGGGRDLLNSYNRIKDASSLGKLAGGAVGGIGGTYAGSKVANTIQNWNKNKQQDRIDNLKYRT